MRHVVLAAIIWIAAFAVYQSNGDTYLYAYDSAPNSLLVLNAFEKRTLSFDAFGGYFARFGASYIFAPARNGRLASIFPVGTALLSAPAYVVFEVQHRVMHQPPIDAPEFERYRLHDEKQAASALAALAVVLMFGCARRLGSLAAAAIVTLFFAFGTQMWTIGSQALWQHGPVNLVVLAMSYAVLRARDATTDAMRARWMAAAGVCAGFLPVVRPTALLFSLAALAFVALAQRRALVPFVAGAIAGAAPGVAWNLAWFGTLVGGYEGNTHNYISDPATALRALVGLLVSPSRGVLVTTPLFVVAAWGAIRAARSRTVAGTYVAALAVAAVVTVVNYAFYVQWWGGSSFGDRFLTDLAAVAALALTFVVPAQPLAFVRANAPRAAAGVAFALFLAWGVAVQFAGAHGEERAAWSAIPLDVDRHPERLWATHDSQIERAARTTLAARFAPAAAPAYVHAFAADVVGMQGAGRDIDGMRLTPGQRVELAATVHNVGAVVAYGYPSGVWSGQTRVRLHVHGAGPAYDADAGELYLGATLVPGGTGVAVGTFTAPPAAGTYDLVAEATLNRLTSRAPATHARHVRITVAPS